MSEGVRGAWGLEERELDEIEVVCKLDGLGGREDGLVIDGVNGSLLISGNEAS